MIRKHLSMGLTCGWQHTQVPYPNTLHCPIHCVFWPVVLKGHFIMACQWDRAAHCLSAVSWDRNESPVSLFYTTEPRAVRDLTNRIKNTQVYLPLVLSIHTESFTLISTLSLRCLSTPEYKESEWIIIDWNLKETYLLITTHALNTLYLYFFSTQI